MLHIAYTGHGMDNSSTHLAHRLKPSEIWPYLIMNHKSDCRITDIYDYNTENDVAGWCSNTVCSWLGWSTLTVISVFGAKSSSLAASGWSHAAGCRLVSRWRLSIIEHWALYNPINNSSATPDVIDAVCEQCLTHRRSLWWPRRVTRTRI